ncbi:MAG: cobyrinate a,c-diamide synthase [Deferrisomatales bacterium]|nr:cobyrinate a,c-diamide synthase [Deferrisomatales bacterium]
MASAFLLAAPHSGAGKTTVTLSLIAAFRARGLRVQPFKAGPDYIDPAHHSLLAGRTSHNLDTWMIPPEANRRIYSAAARDADVSLVEGVMGLFDGVDGRRPEGSSADLAALLGLPVVLVVDARSMARSAAALVHGFATYDPAVRLAGVIWNRVGSPSHCRILDEALADRGLPGSFGVVPREAAAVLPERHLGLVTPEDAGLSAELAPGLARLAEDHLDRDRLLRATARPAPQGEPPDPRSSPRVPRRRIGVPRDAAFCFYYRENLSLLEDAGAEMVTFRPVEGDGVPEGLDGLYLGGGYPEVHAERLSRNQAFREGVLALHRRGAPVYAECGGFMVLCEALVDLEGSRHPMAGVFPAVARMQDRRFQLGYREIEVRGIPRLEGLRARGHEFHYSRVEDMPEAVPRAFRCRSARGEVLPDEGYCLGRTLGGYVHLHFASNPELPRRLFDLP